MKWSKFLVINAIGLLGLIILFSCVKFKMPVPDPEIFGKRYLYPFSMEVKNVTAKIQIDLKSGSHSSDLLAEIPPLKYNKSTLFLLSQDDSHHSSLYTTWAAINGRPISVDYSYHIEHLESDDLPPDTTSLGKTLGSTDGAGNEVRFSFLMTVHPEDARIFKPTRVFQGYKADYNRFGLSDILTFNDIKEMLNFGTGMAFHNVALASSQTSVDTLTKYFLISQKILADSLKGRGSKTLAEPDGNKTYITAIKSIPQIQVVTAQSSVSVLYPGKSPSDYFQVPLARYDYTKISTLFNSFINSIISKPFEKRETASIFIHKSNHYFVQNLLWLNNTYGKDGDDSMWAPSLEEYYEYNYYRLNGNVKVIKDNKTVKLEVFLPSSDYFYYPSVTINVKGLKMADIESVTSGDEVKGMSYADYKDGVMINIDCRKFLMEHATHYVEKYEKTKKVTDRADAIYFVKMLKESSAKRALLTRVGL